MSLFAELRLAHARLALTPTIESVPEATLSIRYVVPEASGEPTLFFAASADDFAAVETALAADPTVADHRCVSERPDERLYRARLLDGDGLASRAADLGVYIRAMTSDGGAWRVEVTVPDRDALVAFREHCAAEGVAFGLKRLRESADVDGGAAGGPDLTDAQREILQLAYDRGYFEEPREASLQDLAAALGVSPTAAGTRLRRATARLVEATVEDD